MAESIRAALVAVAAFGVTHRPGDLSLDDPQVERAREAQGGQLSPPPGTRSRWYLADVETAMLLADQGDLSWAAQLAQASQRDGTVKGVLSTRTDGLVRLPKRFRGEADMVAALEVGGIQARSVFDEMFPASELARLTADGLLLGVGVAELVRVAGRSYPVMVRRDPQFLMYRWNEGRWFFRSVAGLVPITPGDGRWILHVPGGRETPWQAGLYTSIGENFIRKHHAQMNKDNWEAKLANPARVAVAPQGAAEAQKQGWFHKVMAWGVNTVFGLTPGYDVKLLESNGRGADSFARTIEQCAEEITIALAGQTVTTDGGAGFQNSDIHRSIRSDLIQATAEGLAHTINTQGLPAWVAVTYGEERLDECPTVAWDTTPPKDQSALAQAMLTLGQAITSMDDALAAHDLRLDVREILDRHGIGALDESVRVGLSTDGIARVSDVARGAGLQVSPESVRLLLERGGVKLEAIPEGVSAPKRLDLAPTDLAKVVTVDEARASQGLPAKGDSRTVYEAGEDAEPDAPPAVRAA